MTRAAFEQAHVDLGNRVFRECIKLIQDSSVAFHYDNRGKPATLGTAVLFTTAGHYFILTAAHVLDGMRTLNGRISTAGAYKVQTLPPLEMKFVRSNPPEGKSQKKDHHDVAILEVPASSVRTHFAGKTFVRMTDLDPDDDQHPRSLYLVAGFPASEFNQQTGQHKGCCIMSYLYDVRSNPPVEYEAERDIVLDYSKVRSKNLANEKSIPPDVPGMSGCGIWRIIHGSRPLNSWTADQLKLVAIEHSWLSGTYIRGTSIYHYLDFLMRQFPDLSASLDLSYPNTGRPTVIRPQK